MMYVIIHPLDRFGKANFLFVKCFELSQQKVQQVIEKCTEVTFTTLCILEVQKV